MNLHEYQGKQLFAAYGLPVSKGFICDSVETVVKNIKKISGQTWVLKTQVHAGGRGKAGGVKLVSDINIAKEFAKKWLGKNLVTFQTSELGQPVSKILVEECTDIIDELYLGAVIDRSSSRIVFMASTEGGVEIETVAKTNPEKILKVMIDPIVGPQAYQGRYLGFKLGFNKIQVAQFTMIFMGLAQLFMDKDLSLIEINPLVIKGDGTLHCLDAKIVVDSNALYRQKEISEMEDVSQEDSREVEAAKLDLNYVSLDGNIGCMVNGAGLAMGTMDIIALHGGFPANFLDVGGSATKERVLDAFKLILSDEKVKVVLVNIFGGIVRCDMIAEGIIGAIKEVGVNIPIIVRLEGTNSDFGKKALEESGLDIISAISLTDAAEKAVQAAR